MVDTNKHTISAEKVHWLTKPWALAVFWVLVVAAHAAMTLSLGQGLDTDDAHALFLVKQEFRWAYQVRNPPLYEWMLYGYGRLTGFGFHTPILLRYTCILLIVGAAYLSAARLTRSHAAGCLFTLSLLTAYWFTWAFHSWATHSLILTAVMFLLPAAWLHWTEQRSLAAALLLGLLIAVGMLAKWSFIFPVLVLLILLFVRRSTRPALRDSRLITAMLIPAVAVLPTLHAIHAAGQSVVSMSVDNLTGQTRPWLERAVEALWRFPAAWALFIGSWAVVMAILALRHRKADPPPPDSVEQLLMRYTAALLAAGWFLAVLGGAVNLGERYMFPIALPAMLAGMMWLVRCVAVRALLNNVARCALWITIGVLVLRLLIFTSGGFPEGKGNKHLIPYPQLAYELRAMGLDASRIMTTDPIHAGNLMAVLPQARIYSMTDGPLARSSSLQEDHSDLIIWYGGFRAESSPPLAPMLPDSLSMLWLHDDSIRAIDVRWPPTLLGNRRIATWFVIDLTEVRNPSAADIHDGESP